MKIEYPATPVHLNDQREFTVEGVTWSATVPGRPPTLQTHLSNGATLRLAYGHRDGFAGVHLELDSRSPANFHDGQATYLGFFSDTDQIIDPALRATVENGLRVNDIIVATVIAERATVS